MLAPSTFVLGSLIFLGVVCDAGVGRATAIDEGNPIELGRVQWRTISMRP